MSPQQSHRVDFELAQHGEMCNEIVCTLVRLPDPKRSSKESEKRADSAMRFQGLRVVDIKLLYSCA